MRSIDETIREASANLETGLTAAAVDANRRRFGRNALTPLPRDPAWKKFLEKFDEPIIILLLAAALLSLLVSLFEDSRLLGGGALGVTVAAITALALAGQRKWIPTALFLAALIGVGLGLVVTDHAPWDGLAVMVAVVLATGVAFISEYRSDREFEILNAQKESRQVKVIRQGQVHAVNVDEVVAGDLINLEAGDEIPADGRVLEAWEFSVNQSLMTGEPEPASKHAGLSGESASGPDKPDCLYRGTQVMDGAARYVATEVGDATYLGEIARSLSAGPSEESPEIASAADRRVREKLTISKRLTPLQEQLSKLARMISRVGYAAALAIFAALVVRGFIHGELGFPDPGFTKSAENLLAYFLYMVIIIVVAVPEGLPMSVTLSLALAMRQMTRANSLVRRLVACETIGAATVICTDKTGTLTQNQMTVSTVSIGAVTDAQSPEVSLKDLETMHLLEAMSAVDFLALNAAVNSTADLEFNKERPTIIGNSTEGALLRWLYDRGCDYRLLRRNHHVLYQVHFSSERKHMTSVVRVGPHLIAFFKGAPEWILNAATQSQSAKGERIELTPSARDRLADSWEQASARAMRLLAFGYRILPGTYPSDADGLHEVRDRLADEVVFTGWVGIQDPLREDVPEALAACRRAGIKVKVVTGDNSQTAQAIAKSVSLLTPESNRIMTSEEFNAQSDAEIKALLPELAILARAQPLHKLRLVRLLQEQGEVVAVTGDGTNDAPALKRADVGLAMGVAGTEVAKEASQIVLLDDAFSTIVKAVHWGRGLYENIQRFLLFQLTINLSALILAFLGPFVGVKPPFTILQLLWINVIMDTLASLALCSEPPRPGLLDVPPRRRDENILTSALKRTLAATASFFVAAMLTLLLGMRYADWFAGTGNRSPEFPELTIRQVSIFFSVYVFFQIWNEINCRSLTPAASGFAGLPRNRLFLAIVTLIALGQVVIVQFLGKLFKVEPLGLLDWFVIAAGTFSVVVLAEARRFFLRLRTSGMSLAGKVAY